MTDNPTILFLETDIFADQKSVHDALKSNGIFETQSIRIKVDEMDEAAWRTVVRAIIAADKVLLV